MIFLAIIGAALVLLFLFVASRPSAFEIRRETDILAPASAVFSRVNQFKNWIGWSPWEGIDPELKREYSGAEAGVGAGYHWVGNKKVGEGRMTIIGSKPAAQVEIRLEFLKPIKATNVTVFSFEQRNNVTHVVWRMNGNNSFLLKFFGLFFNMDKMVGRDFEKGLAQLKQLSESQ